MFDPLIRKLQAWHRRRATLRLLRQLDDRMLADLGTRRDALDIFVAPKTR